MTGRVQASSAERDETGQLAVEHVIVSEKLCALLAIPAGAHVLDIGCGTGHAALAAARRRAIVTGVDINERSLARARLRAQAEGLDSIEFITADATTMPFPDANFDYALSTFAFVFLPDQERAAAELARIVRPGGVIALTVYTRQSLPSQVYDLVNKLAEMPATPARAHYTWSDGERAAELLRPYFHDIRLGLDKFDSCFPSSADAFECTSRQNPAIRTAFERSSPEVRTALRDGYIGIIERYNRATDGSFMANMDYAVITAVRSGQ